MCRDWGKGFIVQLCLNLTLNAKPFQWSFSPSLPISSNPSGLSSHLLSPSLAPLAL